LRQALQLNAWPRTDLRVRARRRMSEFCAKESTFTTSAKHAGKASRSATRGRRAAPTAMFPQPLRSSELTTECSPCIQLAEFSRCVDGLDPTRDGRPTMNLSNPSARFCAVAAFSLGYLFAPSSPVRGQEWDNDVHYVYCDDRSTDAGPADDSDSSPPCNSGGCDSYRGNYFSDLKQQLTCCMKDMQACGVTYAVIGTQFYQ